MLSDLPLDVNLTERCILDAFKGVADLASQQTNTVFAFFEEGLSPMLAEETGALLIRFKAKLLCNEPKLNVGLKPIWTVSRWKYKCELHARFAYVRQRC